MQVCILSVTSAGNNFNIAGINMEGEWVRPISDGPTAPYWDEVHLSFDLGYGFARVGDIIEFEAQSPKQYQYTYNTEDCVVVEGEIILKKRLPNDKLLWFLEAAGESKQEFEDTVHGSGRSLCIMKVDRIQHYLSENPEDLGEPKMALTNFDFPLLNPAINMSNFTVTDCKWSTLIKSNKVDNGIDFNQIYVVIGLEQFKDNGNKAQPRIIGVHTDPEIALSNIYPY